MSKESVREVIDQLVGLKDREPEELESLFSTQLVGSDDNPYARIYDFEIPEGPFERGDLRQFAEEGRGHISLWARQELELTEDDLALQDWGQVVNIKVNPQISPEGVDSLVFSFGEVEVTVQFTHQSRKLRSIALDW